MRLPEEIYGFEEFVLDPSNLRLTANGRTRPLEPKSLRLLQYLIGKRRRIVPKEEILRVVWEDIAVSDNALTRAIAQIRKALDDDPKEPRFIETIPTVGYRFTGQLIEQDPLAAPPAALELRRIAEIAPQPKLRRHFGAAWLAATVFAAMFAVTLVVHLREKPPEARVVRLQISPPGNDAFSGIDMPVLSPDGTRIVFSNGGKLFVRSLDSLVPRELPGTGPTGHFPFWSPDGRTVAFFAAGKLKTINLAGGAPATLCNVANAPGGTWNRSNMIVFAPNPASALTRIAASGGTPAPVTKLDASKGETSHAWPSFLPDGKHFLFAVYASKPENAGVFVGSLDSPRVARLLPEATNAQYMEPGYLLFSRGGNLMGQPFDAGRLQFTGDPFFIAEEVSESGLSPSLYSAAAGILAYRTGSAERASRLLWFDRNGNQLGEVGSGGYYSSPALSPDGRAVAVAVGNAQHKDIWVFDLARGTKSRLTFGGADLPRWSPDGREIAFSYRDGSRWVVHRMAANGAGKEELAAQLDRDAPLRQWTADGQYLIMDAQGLGKPIEIWSAPVSGGGKPFPVVAGPVDDLVGKVSPDGKWIAYLGNETGTHEAYVQDFPANGGKWQISTAGANAIRWRTDGRELFYKAISKVMSVEVKTNGGKFEAGIPRLLFDVPGFADFDVSADGRKFLLVVPNAEAGPPQPFTVMINWLAGTKR